MNKQQVRCKIRDRQKRGENKKMEMLQAVMVAAASFPPPPFIPPSLSAQRGGASSHSRVCSQRKQVAPTSDQSTNETAEQVRHEAPRAALKLRGFLGSQH